MILWLVLKINNDKYIYLYECWHKCILKYCIKDDSNVIRKRFTSDYHGVIKAVNVNGISLLVEYRDDTEFKLKDIA